MDFKVLLDINPHNRNKYLFFIFSFSFMMNDVFLIVSSITLSNLVCVRVLQSVVLPIFSIK